MAVRAHMTVRVHVAWWLRWYIAGVALTASITGMEPDWEKFERWVLRAVRLKEVR